MADVDPSNRKAYLEEQGQRQKRGEPIGIDWVRDELIRVHHEQLSRVAAALGGGDRRAVADRAVDQARPRLQHRRHRRARAGQIGVLTLIAVR